MIDFSTVLNKGKENGIHSRQLAEILGITQRELRLNISQARQDGQVIASSPAGYYIPAGEDEVREYVSIMWARTKSTFKNMKSAKTWLKEHSEGSNGQMSIFD